MATLFASAFGTVAALAIARTFPGYSVDYNKDKILALRDFAEFAESCHEHLVKLINSVSSERIPDSTALSEVIGQWFAAKKKKYYPAQAMTLAANLGSLRAVLRPLQSIGLIAQVKFPRMPHNYHAYASHKPSLVETGRRDTLCVEIVAEMRKLAKEMGMELPSDAAGYIAGLAEAIPLSQFPNEEVFRKAIQRENWKRLEIIRSVAERAVIKASELFEEGKALVAQGDPRIVDKFQRAVRKTGPQRDVAMAKIFPLDDHAQATANLLKYCVDAHGGRVPRKKEFSKQHAATFMLRLCQRLGGRRRLTSMLSGDPDGIAGVALLYLVDSGDNVSTAIELTPRCIEPTDEPNRVKVVSQKGRSAWKPIVDTFDVVDPAVQVTVPQALEFAIRTTNQMRKIFPEFSETLLMFYWFDEGPSAVGYEFIGDRLRHLLRDAGHNVAKEMLPSSIRQSYIIDRTLATDARPRPAEILAKHQERGGQTTRIYTSRFPVKLLLAARIRTFQHILETDLLFNGLKLDEALGRTRAEGLEMLAAAERTGNGLRCRNSKAGEGPTSHVGDTCEDAGLPCVDCKQRLFVVDEDTVEDAVRTKLRLERKMKELEATSPARWEGEILPELAFVMALIQKLARSPHASLLRRVQKKCNSEREVAE
ncbi:hypothetical protein [Paraburkholderia flava]|uniref:hypothetical protein n=1 Tax=Paraburkholderia flava TaxID=2547393 RepID=UPI00105E3F78|nr:hypothetical protein [Paraburkholderia flava]